MPSACQPLQLCCVHNDCKPGPGWTSGNNEHTEKDVVQGTHLVKDGKLHLSTCCTALRGIFNTVVAWVDLERRNGVAPPDFGGHV